MNKLPYYKKYPRDFIEATIGMDLEIKGAYSLVLDLIYMQSGELPDDAKYISGLLGCSVRKWNCIRKELLKINKISCENGFISNLRADKELETIRKLQDKQSEKRLGCNKNNDLAETTVKPSRVKPEPEPDSKKTIQKRFDDFWNAFSDKRGKDGALRVWNRKQLDQKADEIIRGAKAYVKLRGEDHRYWKQAQGWLNDGRWEDEDLKRITKPQIQRTAFGDIPDNTNMSIEDIQRKAGMIQ